MKPEHVLYALIGYLVLHWLIANDKVPTVLVPLAKAIENKELTMIFA